MKKLFLLAAVALTSVAAQAQIVSSRSSQVIRHEEPKPVVVNSRQNISYFRLGLSFDNMIAEDADGFSSKAGYLAAFGFQNFLNNSPLYFGMEFGLSSRGYKCEPQNDRFFNHNIHSLMISPVNFGYRVGIGDGIELDPHIGLNLTYDLFGNVSSDDYDTDDLDWDYFPLGDNELKKFGASMTVGVGVWFTNQFNVDLSIRPGLTQMFDDTGDQSVKSRKIVLSCALAF